MQSNEDKNTTQHNQRPPRRYVIKWVVNPYRKDKRTGALNPVPRCDYLNQLFADYERCLRGEDQVENTEK
jgi:hypothetical protein